MKFCPYCGRQANDEDIFCQGCGSRLDNNESDFDIEGDAETSVVERPKGAPHWLIKMLSIISLLCGILFFLGQGAVAVGTGIACLCLDKKGEYRGRSITGIVLGSIGFVAYVIIYVWEIIG